MSYYDYENQAWVVNGVYSPCGHRNCHRFVSGDRLLPLSMNEGSFKVCYGTNHEGEKPTPEIEAKYNPEKAA